MNNIKKLLNDEVSNEMELLNKMNFDDENYKTAIHGITELVDRAIELEKVEIEHDKIDNQINDNQLKQNQLESENKDRKVKNILTGVSIVVPAALTVWGTLKSFKFEEEGTVTTIIGRGFLNKLLPKK